MRGPSASRRRAASRISGPVSGATMSRPPRSGRRHRLDPVEEDGLVGDRHELLGARVGYRTQASALAPRENQTLQLLHRATHLTRRGANNAQRHAGAQSTPASFR